jgi:hypothetical protein
MEVQLHQRRALHVTRLDVMNSADIEEVVLVVVGEKPFHLRRVHAAIGLADVDHRQVEAGEDVDFHSSGKPFRVRKSKLLADRSANGQHAAQGDGQNDHHHGEWPPQGQRNQSHTEAASISVVVSQSRLLAGELSLWLNSAV